MKTKIIPFDLGTAKKIQAGEIEGKIKTRCGDEVRIVCWDSTVRYCGFTQPIIAQEWGGSDLYSYFENGCYIKGDEHPKDLVLEVPYNEPKFKPFDKVLARDDASLWRAGFYSHEMNGGYCVCGDYYTQCIPYKGNENLIGTDKEPNEQ